MERNYEITVTVRAIQRAERLSVNGNPRFSITTDQGVFGTQTDAAINYSMENFANRRLSECILDREVTLQCTRAKLVYGIKMDGKILH